MFLQNTKRETKTGIQAEKKGWWPGFILRIQKACLVTKKGACQRRGSGSRLFDLGKRLDQTKVFLTNCCACSGAFPSQF